MKQEAADRQEQERSKKHVKSFAHAKRIEREPGQTLVPVFVTASITIRILFLFFGPSAAPPLWHLKNVETVTQRRDFF
jgi:hypothetical protein